jgi:PAS domain S-box-containing protein
MAKKPTYEQLEQRVKELKKEAVKRKRAEEAVRESEEFSLSLLTNAPNPMLVINTDSSVKYVNPALESVTGFSSAEVIGKKAPYLWWTQETLQKTTRDLKGAMAKGAQRLEELFQKKNGERFWVEITSAPIKRNGEFKYYLSNWVDITGRKQAEEAIRKAHDDLERRVEDRTAELTKTNEQLKVEIKERKLGEEALQKAHDELEQRVEERTAKLARTTKQLKLELTERKRAEGALRESEEKYKTLIESSLTGIFIHQDGKYVFVNDRFAEIHGYKPEQLLGKRYLTLLLPDERKTARRMVSKRLKGETVSPRYEVQRLRKDGTAVWCEMMATRIEYRGRPAIMGNIIDITERKRVEEELREMIRRMEIAGEQSIIYARELNREIADRKRTEQKLLTYHEKLRSLASALSLTEERERHRIAIEVHDHIAQKLAFAKIKLGTLRASTSSTSLAGTTDEIMELVNEIIQDIRSLISQLSSPILYELGFVPAVEWLAQETRKRHGILVEFADDGQPKPLSDDVCVLLFQAVRELLVNVAKHAQARSAKVSITRDGAHIEVDVEDDGVGFDTGKLAPSVDENGRFGLFSIRVRLDPLGGHIEVESKPGHGTRVTLMAPLKGNGEYKKEKVS